MRFFWLMFVFVLPVWAATPLQPLIDGTPTGGTLRPAAGVYAGPAVIDRPLTIDGGGHVSVEGGGTVLILRTNGATVRGLRLAGSGDSHDQIHAGIQIEGDDNRIEDNQIDDVLFGIHVKQGNRNRILRNRIVGKDLPLGQRGDGLRLWNSRHNVIEGNHFKRIRDLTFANSPENTVAGNTLEDGRYGMQFVFSPRSQVVGNRLSHTGTGIVVLYSPELTVRGNYIAHALEGGGGGLAFKESGNALVEGNEILHCAVGLQANSPVNDESVLTVRGNRFAHNIIGMYFYGEQGGHRITGNRFENNLTQVAVSAAGTGAANAWRGNYWSDYQGFDRNGDGIGDTPHELWLHADRIWMDTPKASFFRNSPALELLDFLERLAPFASPSLILRDTLPRMR
ncbi:MAG TPA: nitrous oxide reductase family maturation protein NosD [Rhodocyclaceae bacterium]|nr:nitrous oxide reductase family maturation protein NosD [Rhodocyclaceae bacterium]